MSADEIADYLLQRARKYSYTFMIKVKRYCDTGQFPSAHWPRGIPGTNKASFPLARVFGRTTRV